MSLEERINRLEEGIAQAEQLVRLTERILGGSVRTEPLPANLEKMRGTLRSARDLAQRDQPQKAEPLLRQAEDNLRAVQQWLAVADLAISPFALRTFLEKSQSEPQLLRALIRYLLGKHPHAESDRDKLDYLLTASFAPGGPQAELLAHDPEALRGALDELFVGLEPEGELSGVAEVTMHELESLIALLDEFNDFDKLVQARMVERVRALKTNLGDEFYRPRLLATVIRFNLTFRRHFEELFGEEVNHVRRMTRRLIAEAWELVQAIEAAHEDLSLRAGKPRVAVAPLAGDAPDEAGSRLGRPLDLRDERPPLDRLIGRGQEKKKEQELRGIIQRLARFLEKLPPDQAAAKKVLFRLRRGEMALEAWEREAFGAAAVTAAPESTAAIQQTLGVIAWMEEELAHYEEMRHDRYLWKSHLDVLGYAVKHAVRLLSSIRALFREGAPAGEAAWFDSLLHTALRLGTSLNRITPLFEPRTTA